MKKILLIILSAFLLVGCSKTEEKKEENLTDYKVEENEELTYEIESDNDNPVAVMTLEDGSKIAIELYPEYAPNTVNNFIHLANEEKFYDGLIFHRVMSDFMVQIGCPYGTGGGGPGYTIKGEFTNNDFEQNTLLNKKGTVAMARTPLPDSAGSQFYINVFDNAHLDGEYAVFGMVISGYDKVVEISKVKTNADDKPASDIVVKSVRVDTKGKTYAEPEMIK